MNTADSWIGWRAISERSYASRIADKYSYSARRDEMSGKNSSDKSKVDSRLNGRFGYQPTSGPEHPKPPQGGAVTQPPPPNPDKK